MSSDRIKDVTADNYWVLEETMGEGNSVILLVGSISRDKRAKRSSLWYGPSPAFRTS